MKKKKKEKKKPQMTKSIERERPEKIFCLRKYMFVIKVCFI
jgi:hypothetical protein